MGITGNEVADWLARMHAQLPDPIPLPIPNSLVKLKASAIGLAQWRAHWAEVGRQPKGNNLRQTRIFFPVVSTGHDKWCISRTREELKRLTAIVTGHGSVKYHLMKMGISQDDICRFCGETSETSEHLIFDCPRFYHRRVDIFRSHTPRDILPGVVELERDSGAQIRLWERLLEFTSEMPLRGIFSGKTLLA